MVWVSSVKGQLGDNVNGWTLGTLVEYKSNRDWNNIDDDLDI
jgi:hypothetical protein